VSGLEPGSQPRRRAAPLDAIDAIELMSPWSATARKRASARKRVVASDPYLSGHYPGFPIYPGAFILESAVRAAEILVTAGSETPPLRLVAIDTVRFISPVFPGETLSVEVAATDADGGLFRIEATCANSAQEPVATARFTLQVEEATGV
jgi:3-hydroxyacyl-[acyl-carrier-protein] dehydratase